VSQSIPPGWTGRRSTLFAGSPATAGTTRYNAYGGDTTTADTSTVGLARIPFNCVVRSMYCGTDADPGVGKSVSFTFRKEGADTGLAVAVVAGTTENQNGVDVALNAGDTWSVKIVQTAGGAATYAHAAMVIEEVP
jgi:hypothetical protein